MPNTALILMNRSGRDSSSWKNSDMSGVSEEAILPAKCRVAAHTYLSFDASNYFAHLEDRQIHCYNHAADQCAKHHHDDGFH